jgi:3-oxoacyl-(acyl-carrier-protein) synthase
MTTAEETFPPNGAVATRGDREELLRRALLEVRAARAKAAALELARGAPVAVLGVGCRLPGGADSAEAFWDLLVSGRNAVSGVPADRWDAEAWYDPDPDAPGRTYARHGGFIEGVRDFDAALFGISPREAESMDPQHRILLEVAWHALEHAAIAPDSLRSSRTGVFIGMRGSDYERMGARDVTAITPYGAIGTAWNLAANRLSFTLGLQGPSLVVDTACSSSLVAVHLACQALRAGECDLALAGGVNLMLSPDAMVALAKGRMLSVSGQCRTFDAAADGYVRGEGAGIVVLRRLSDAERGRDPVLAVIRGTAVNQDGRSNGLTAPSGAAQEEVIRTALRDAGVEPDQVGYVEAHGTGTALGDPIEIRALAAVMTPRTSPLAVGSVKTNIGHLEAAAGIAGLIKAVLAVHHGVIPPHLNLTDPSPHIPWTPDLTVPAAPVPWTAPDRIAGVSSFGFGGTNAHLIVQNHPAPPTSSRCPPTPPPPCAPPPPRWPRTRPPRPPRCTSWPGPRPPPGPPCRTAPPSPPPPPPTSPGPCTTSPPPPPTPPSPPATIPPPAHPTSPCSYQGIPRRGPKSLPSGGAPAGYRRTRSWRKTASPPGLPRIWAGSWTTGPTFSSSLGRARWGRWYARPPPGARCSTCPRSHRTGTTAAIRWSGRSA